MKQKLLKIAKIIYLLFTLFSVTEVHAQTFTEQSLHQKLDSLSGKSSGWNNQVQLNVLDLPLYEFIYSLGLENNLNISIDPSLTQTISYNFYDARVKDVFVFIYLNFEVEYEFVGNIISVKKRTIALPNIPFSPKKLEISYNPSNEFLSVNLQQDTLWRVLETITKLTDKNIVIHPEVRGRLVNGFFQNRPVDQVLDMLMKGNGMQIVKDKEGIYTVQMNVISGSAPSVSTNGVGMLPQGDNFRVTLNSLGKLDVHAMQIDLIELIKTASHVTGSHYILQSQLEGKSTVEVKNMSMEELLQHILRGTKYNYYLSSEKVFVIGENKAEGLRKTEIIRMENRTIENVLSAVPKELLSDITLSEFVQLNGLIVTGNERSIAELKKFLASIDVVVPMIQIDVMFLFSKNQHTTKTGVQAGLKDTPTATEGTIFPGLDMNLGAASINSLLNAINGFGILNLGQVTENFYVSLSALESNNVISIESTPKIATLNGNEASITIGETTYYQETQVNVQTSVTQQGVLQSKIWKDISADLSVKIKPFVSADEQITMSIVVSQNDFAGKADASAPPNMTKQTFQSMVRVKNGEVILLGGLEKKSKNDSGSGVPLLSRIPVLKWLFSGRSKSAEKSKLHILVRSTVTY